MSMRVLIACLFFIFCHSGVAWAQIQNELVGFFNRPVYGTSAPGTPGTLHVVQQGGQIFSLNTATGSVASTPLLNLATQSGSNFVTGGEQGLLGLAFHPNYQNNGLMYVKYTYDNGQVGGALRIEQYQVTGGVADPASRQTVLQFDHPTTTNHNGGWIGFNPMNGSSGGSSGQLYITTGDGGSGNDSDNNAQNRNSLLGKVLRIDVGNGLSTSNPTYSIPTGNMTGAGTRSELYSYGLRNPFRASFDRANGNFYIADVGESAREEINFIANGSAGGQNFGWRMREGTIANPAPVGGPRPPDNVDPIFDYAHSTTNGRSITGGYVYRGTQLDDNGQALDGKYFFADFISGRVYTIEYDGTVASQFTDRTAELGFTPGTGFFSSFAEDGFGNLYIMSVGGGVYKIVPVPEPATVGVVAALAAFGLRSLRRRKA